MDSEKRKFIIADGGSTKCSWAIVSISDIERHVNLGKTCGVNPMQLNAEEIESIWRKDSNLFDTMQGAEVIYYYGAGCIGGEVNDRIANAIRNLTGVANIEVASDMLGAVRALPSLDQTSGVACILGTGCNSCTFEDGKITGSVRPLGYILGDEGSGADIGKHIVADALKGILPADLTESFYRFADADYQSIIRRIYSEPRANAYLASFARFAKENIERPEIRSIVKSRFRAFAERNVLLYPQKARSGGLGFVGSIAANFEDVLREACAEVGIISEINIIGDPILPLTKVTP